MYVLYFILYDIYTNISISNWRTGTEANAAYMRRCRVCALYAAERCGWSMVRCSDGREAFSPAAIAECIWKVLMDGNK